MRKNWSWSIGSFSRLCLVVGVVILIGRGDVWSKAVGTFMLAYISLPFIVGIVGWRAEPGSGEPLDGSEVAECATCGSSEVGTTDKSDALTCFGCAVMASLEEAKQSGAKSGSVNWSPMARH